LDRVVRKAIVVKQLTGRTRYPGDLACYSELLLRKWGLLCYSNHTLAQQYDHLASIIGERAWTRIPQRIPDLIQIFAIQKTARTIAHRLYRF